MDSSRSFEGVKTSYPESYQKIFNLHVAIVGIGGVGSWAAECLARSGVKEITLIDHDEVCISNVNRQVLALTSTVGRSKVEVLKERLNLINPNLIVHAKDSFFDEPNANDLLTSEIDFVIDAIDLLHQKTYLISYCYRNSIPLVSTGGCGGVTDPRNLEIRDLNKCEHDQLLFKVRRELRRKHDFPRGRSPWGIKCVFSKERKTFHEIERSCDPFSSETLRRPCETGYGSMMHVTASVGLFAAYTVIDLATGRGEV